MFSRLYLEITTCCNLSCSFCPGTKRPAAFLSPEQFRYLAQKLRPYIEECLDEREAQIIRLRYGLGGTVPLTQREIASTFGISRSYVSRIEKRALEKLRAELEKPVGSGAGQ